MGTSGTFYNAKCLKKEKDSVVPVIELIRGSEDPGRGQSGDDGLFFFGGFFQ